MKHEPLISFEVSAGAIVVVVVAVVVVVLMLASKFGCFMGLVSNLTPAPSGGDSGDVASDSDGFFLNRFIKPAVILNTHPVFTVISET